MSCAIVWLRQDLRIADNPALFEACKNHKDIIPLYILDKKNNGIGGAQTWWLHHSLVALQNALHQQLGLTLIFRKGDPLTILSELTKTFSIQTIYWNRCYEPQSIARDTFIKAQFQKEKITVMSFNGSLLNEPWTIHNKNGAFFKVFTPYWKACLQALHTQQSHLHREAGIPTIPLQPLTHQPLSFSIKSDTLQEWDLLPRLHWAAQFSDYWTPGEAGAQQQLHRFITQHLQDYKIQRDIPAEQATSHLSPHLHFGEISPWSIFKAIEHAKNDPHCNLGSADHFLSELGWREFSYYLLYHAPSMPEKNIKSEFDHFPWHNDTSLLKRWQKGMTGYPIIDAGMRELWTTGYMHNRVRMIVASFLTKGLFIDWRIGADWFLNTLLDADLANNSASWQWVAGCGADAAPYFRIFNPVLQSQKFDPHGIYIRRWVPELSTLRNEDIHAPWESSNTTRIYDRTNYPRPIINHSEARTKALSYYSGLKRV